MPGPYVWGARSRSRLDTCHPLLITLLDRVIKRADLPLDLSVLCGERNAVEQAQAFKSGASKLPWPKSKHNKSPSHAIDVAPFVAGAVSWDWTHYHQIAPIIKDDWTKLQADGLTGAAVLTWGGDWRSFKDGPHWELSGV